MALFSSGDSDLASIGEVIMANFIVALRLPPAKNDSDTDRRRCLSFRVMVQIMPFNYSRYFLASEPLKGME